MKKLYISIAIILVAVTLLADGCTSKTTIIEQTTTTVTQLVTQSTALSTTTTIAATSTTEKKVYFVTGDGEAIPSDTLSDLAYALNTDLLQVVPWDLQVQGSIPSDCAVLVVAGPTTPMTASERQILSDYLANDGYAIFLTNPNSPDDIAQLLNPWGVMVQSSTIIDPSDYVAPNENILQIPASRDYIGETNVYFPGATAIIAKPTAPTDMDVTALVWTTTNSYLDKTFDPSVAPKFDSTTEVQQSYAVGVLIKPTDILDSSGNDTGVPYPGPYIVAFGDSDFITNTNFYSANNADMFLRLVKYLVSGTN